MRFGIGAYTMQLPGSTRAHADLYREMLDQIRLAENLREGTRA